jgi:thiol-disulfide isomerase/thioredoxin
MKRISHIFTLIIAVAAIALPCLAQETNADAVGTAVNTVHQCYPNLASGVLTYAKVQTLPEGVLLKTEALEVTDKDIEQAIAQQPEPLRADLKKNSFFVLEQEAGRKLLKMVAVRELAKDSKDANSIDDNQLFRTFLEKLTKDVKVQDGDIETFYKENESMFCDTPLESVREYIESYVLNDKKQRFIDQYVRTLGQKIDITVSDSWTKQQARSAKDNPLDKARDAGKPTLAIFSAAGCCGPDKMLPVKDALLKQYDTKISILYIEPSKEPILAARYAVRSIPTQVLYDSKGKEYFRHSGFFSEKDIAGKLTEMGVR